MSDGAMSANAMAILDVVEQIPFGEVMSYGEVALAAGVGSARLVGTVLARYGDEVPWHRVVRSDGTMARHLRVEQAALLSAEGVRLDSARRRVARG